MYKELTIEHSVVQAMRLQLFELPVYSLEYIFTEPIKHTSRGLLVQFERNLNTCAMDNAAHKVHTVERTGPAYCVLR